MNKPTNQPTNVQTLSKAQKKHTLLFPSPFDQHSHYLVPWQESLGIEK